MKQTIVTICSEGYAPLLEHWVTALKSVCNLPITVLCLNGFESSHTEEFTSIPINPAGNPFPADLPDHVCAEKLRVFKHLPSEIEEILFLDLDILALRPFWEDGGFFETSRENLVMCPDLFVGYKEKMEAEFQPYDTSFRMKFNPDGSYFYFNTGMFFASRQAHAHWFSKFLQTWSDYVRTMSRYPSIFDQNVFNYCLIRYGLEVYSIPVVNNCLRQYETQTIKQGCMFLNGQTVNAYHFNGGDGEKKLERWIDMLHKLEGTQGVSS